MNTLTKVISDTRELPPVTMRFFSDNVSAERYAAQTGNVIYYCVENLTYYVEYAQPTEAVK